MNMAGGLSAVRVAAPQTQTMKECQKSKKGKEEKEPTALDSILQYCPFIFFVSTHFNYPFFQKLRLLLPPPLH
jgi:hypothetical protein